MAFEEFGCLGGTELGDTERECVSGADSEWSPSKDLECIEVGFMWSPFKVLECSCSECVCVECLEIFSMWSPCNTISLV